MRYKSMYIRFMFRIYKLFVYFMKESLNFCIYGKHPIEVHYNSSFIYAYLIYAAISRNLTLV
jgi:hypothetical protein